MKLTLLAVMLLATTTSFSSDQPELTTREVQDLLHRIEGATHIENKTFAPSCPGEKPQMSRGPAVVEQFGKKLTKNKKG